MIMMVVINGWFYCHRLLWLLWLHFHPLVADEMLLLTHFIISILIIIFIHALCMLLPLLSSTLSLFPDYIMFTFAHWRQNIIGYLHVALWASFSLWVSIWVSVCVNICAVIPTPTTIPTNKALPLGIRPALLDCVVITTAFHHEKALLSLHMLHITNVIVFI